MVKFVWNDLLTTEHRLPRGLSHDEMSQLFDMCEYADAFKEPLKPEQRARFDKMIADLDFNWRSVKAHEAYLRKKAAALRAAQQKRMQLEMEARRQREEEEQQEITVDCVRRVFHF